MSHLLLVGPIHHMYMPVGKLCRHLITKRIQLNSLHKHYQDNITRSLINYISNISCQCKELPQPMSYKLYMLTHLYMLNNMKDKTGKDLKNL